MKAYLTDINRTKQTLLYAKGVDRVVKQQKALQILSKNGNKRLDNLSISDTARSFSKESIAAMIDGSVNISKINYPII